MIEPKIVFCSSNHIFDAAINSECPYCKKIAAEQKALSDTVNGVSRKRIVVADLSDEERTELIVDNNKPQKEYTELISRKVNQLVAEGYKDISEEYTELISREDKDEYTELLYKEKSKTDIPTKFVSEKTDEEDEYTELIYQKTTKETLEVVAEQKVEPEEKAEPASEEQNNKVEILKNEGRVIGWLVLKNGTKAGHSIEICQGTKYIYDLQGSCITSSESNDKIRLLATVTNEDTLSISPEKDVVLTVNGVDKNVYRFPRSYDEVVIANYHLSYVEVMTHFMRWED